MKRCTLALTPALTIALSFVFFVAAAPQARAQSANHLYHEGQQAEQRNQIEAAYEFYYQAYKKKPSDERYRVSYERLKYPAAALHVERGEALMKVGENTPAVTEFLRAIEIDPSNELAAQDIELVRKKVNGHSSDAVTPRTSDEAFSGLAGPLRLKPISDEPLTLHMVEDSKVVYQTVGKAAGINVLFDPDYTSKRIQVDLANTTLEDALRIIATVSNTFYRPITSNTIFVAANTRTKRSELDEQAVQTFYLHNVTQQSDFTDIQTALRNVFQTAKLYGVASQNAIVMRATPDELLLARQLINNLDKPKAEVVVDIAVLEVSRDKLRNIGIQLPQTASVNFQQANANTSSTTSTSSTSTASTSTTTSSLTLNNLAHLNSNNFAVTIGQAQANLLLTDTSTRIIQDPRVRVSDGQEGTLKIGEKLPVATGSYQTGAATAIVSSLVNTQFQYLDVGVNVDVKPIVMYDRDVSMKVKIEVSSTNGTEDLGGVDEPIITQRVAEETVRLKDGEANLMGGIMQHQVTRTVSGTPGLAELPLLKYLFSTQQKETTDDEIVFLLIPHVVRAQMLDPENTQEIDTGTTNDIQVRQVAKNLPDAESTVQTSNGIAPPPNVVQAMEKPAGAVSAPIPPSSVEAAASGAINDMRQQTMGGPPVALQLTPRQDDVKAGSTFQLAVNVDGGHDVYSVPMQMKYDPTRLSLVNVDLGDQRGRSLSYLGKDGQAVALVHRDNGDGEVSISASRPPGAKGVSGNGQLCVLTFQAKAPGDATVAITQPMARNSQQQTIPAVGSMAVVHVQ